VFVDVESTLTPLHEQADQHILRLGWACLARYVPYHGLEVIGWQQITDSLTFWRTISDIAANHKDTYVIAHNIGYDARVLHAFSILPGIGWTPSYAIMGKSCTFFTFKADKNRINLLDNMNYWQCSLADIGRDLGLPKLDIDPFGTDDATLSHYCHRDVEILVKAWDYWLEFLDKHNLGDFSITVSGQALAAYRHAFMHHKIGIHNNKEAVALERESYKGGRCEITRVGHFTDGPFYKLDVNGLYAYVMQTYPCPRRLVKVISEVSPEYLGKLLEQYQVIADCIVETGEPIYAVHMDGYNLFPTGVFRATLTTWDLILALNNGHLRAIGPCALYESADLFKSFINYFTPLRQQYKAHGDLARSKLCKMIRNGLYGKFGQKGYRQKVVDDAPLRKVSVKHWLDDETGGKCDDWTFGGKVLRQFYEGEGNDSFPAIASHIAAAGRSVLWGYIQIAGPENYYYADTDSLFVNQAGLDRLHDYIDPIELGYLKVEGTSPDLEIVAKKDYVFDGERKTKGIRKSATRTEDGGWKQTHFTSIRWGFNHGDLDDVITYDVVKHNKLLTHYGKIGKDGRISPPVFSLDRDQITEIVQPIDSSRWDWWIDLPWLGTLETRKRPPILPDWFLRLLSDSEVALLDDADDQFDLA